MTAISEAAGKRAGIKRDAVTWYAYLILGYFTFLNTSQGNIVPFLMEELQLTYGQVSLHSSAIALGLIVVSLIGERVISRYGRRAILIFGAVASAIALTILAFAPSAYVSVAACFLMGVTGAFIPAVVSALLSDIHGSGRDIALAEANAVCYGFAIAAPLIAGLVAAMGWTWRFIPLAGVVSAVVIVATFARSSIPEGVRAVKGSGQGRLPPPFWGYWAMLGFVVALEFSALLWAPAYLERVVGMSASAAAVAASAFFVAMLVGRIVGIRLVAMYASRNIFFVLSALTFVGFVAYWLALLPAVAVGGLFLIGLGISLLFPITISFAMGAAGTASDRASTRAMLAPGLAVILNPPLLGVLADNIGLWWAQTMIPVFAALAICAFLVAQRLERTYSASSS